MKLWVAGLVVLLMAATAGCGTKSDSGSGGNGTSPAPTPAEVQKIAEDAYVYGFPMVDMYRIMNAYFINSASPLYLGGWNRIHSIARVFTPADTAVQTPNSDTPYSTMGVDLRTEPLVLTIPKIEDGRYFSVSFIDAYTYDYALLGSRTSGNGGGKYLLAGPGWKGEKPAGIDKVITSDTDFGMVLYRTQLFNPQDLDNVKKVQQGYQVEPLSTFEKKDAPKAAPAVDFPTPLTPETEKTSIDFFKVLNFTLQYAPVLPSEKDVRARFAKIGVTGDAPFDPSVFSEKTTAAFLAGMKAGQAKVDTFLTDQLATGKVSSGDLFGSAEQLKGNYLYRMAGTFFGILGLPGAEALYFPLKIDNAGAPLNAANGTKYTITFPAGQLPPVNAFWSVTMYKLPQSLLVENPINRYLINSPMTDQLKKNPDGSVTIYLQNTSPAPELEPNWLPAPDGPFDMVMRLYWPKPEVSEGKWTAPKVTKV